MAPSLGGFRNRTIMLLIGGAVFVLLIWYVAYFSPSAKKLASVNSQTQSALTEQSQLNTQLARLRSYSRETGTLVQLSNRLSAALPPTQDIYNYLTALSNAANAAGVAISSVDPSTPTTSGAVSVIPIDVSTKGTYDQTLSFIKDLYALPRLTIITGVQLSGGGASTNRATELDTSFSMAILAQSSASPTNTG
jgi:Tfp pilus assembly protein PilO